MASVPAVGIQVDAEVVEQVEDLANLCGCLAALHLRDELNADATKFGHLPLGQVLGLALFAHQRPQLRWTGDGSAAVAEHRAPLAVQG